jgi:hypothetical protein
MATAGQAPQASGKTVIIKIRNDGTVDLPTANANVGDIVEFHNLASSSKVVQFLDDNNGNLLPIALEIPNGGKSDFLATITGTVYYGIGLGRLGGKFGPDDDGYQVIVGSGDPDKR